MGPYQRTPKKVTRAIKYPGLGVRSVGPLGDFLDGTIFAVHFQYAMKHLVSFKSLHLGNRFPGQPPHSTDRHWNYWMVVCVLMSLNNYTLVN